MRINLLSIALFAFSAISCRNIDQKNITDEYISELHDRILTVDSHTDTPLHFIRDSFDFSSRHDPDKDGIRSIYPG